MTIPFPHKEKLSKENLKKIGEGLRKFKKRTKKDNNKYFKNRGIFCSRCGFYKFKTIKKGIEWECRKCGYKYNKN